jgi:hypothetical protein
MVGLQRGLFIPSAIALLLLIGVSCGQTSRPQGEKFVKGKGPAGLDVNTEYAVLVRGPAEYACTFKVEGGKAFVLYRRESSRWEPKVSCNNGAGENGTSVRLPPDGADWMITGWYTTSDRTWRQCNFMGWQSEKNGEALVCKTSDIGWMKLICPKGRCNGS